MKTLCLAFAVMCAVTVTPPAIAQESEARVWRVVEETDPLTDKAIREACAASGAYTFCASFAAEGVWFTLHAGPSGKIFGDAFPAMRIDKNDAYESVAETVRELEATTGRQWLPRTSKPTFQTWRGQVPSASGEWEATPPALIRQMVAGEKLLVRARFIGGQIEDLFIPLTGFCEAAAAVYAPGAPPLECG